MSDWVVLEFVLAGSLGCNLVWLTWLAYERLKSRRTWRKVDQLRQEYDRQVARWRETNRRGRVKW